MNKKELSEKIDFMKMAYDKGINFTLCLKSGYNFRTLETYLIEDDAVTSTGSFVLLQSLKILDRELSTNSLRNNCTCCLDNLENDEYECKCNTLTKEQANEMYLDKLIEKINNRAKLHEEMYGKANI